MGDLISRKAVIELLKKNVTSDIEEVIVTDKNIKLIESMPTAYDMEKVVQQLEETKSVISRFDFESQKRIGLVYLDSAIDIARKGGAT